MKPQDPMATSNTSAPRKTPIGATAALFLCAISCGRDAPPGGALDLDLQTVLGGDGDGYEQALEPPELTFPRDHGPHNDFRSEWWYFTGNLADARAEDPATAERFGFQWTLFRSALAPPAERAVGRQSPWAAEQTWMGHLGITSNREGGIFHSSERFSRGALGLAGAQVDPKVKVWLEDWSLESIRPGRLFPCRLKATSRGDEAGPGQTAALDLVLQARKIPVYQGDGGLSQKGDAPGNASIYYSVTRISCSGTITLDGRETTVTGNAWLDREWSTSALEDGVVGWDWFALQTIPEVGDRDPTPKELMLYRLRTRDGGTHHRSAGVLVGAEGQPVHFGAGDFRLEELERWTAPDDGATYPLAWKIDLPGLDGTLDGSLTVRPLVEDQEHRLAARYWEGAVTFSGTLKGKPVAGRGYLEMTGYGAAAKAGSEGN